MPAIDNYDQVSEEGQIEQLLHEENNIYDQTTHNGRREPDSGNIYDHTSNMEGTYNTTDFCRDHKDSVNIYEHAQNVVDEQIMSDEENLGDYDTCINGEIGMSNAHPDSEDSNTATVTSTGKSDGNV